MRIMSAALLGALMVVGTQAKADEIRVLVAGAAKAVVVPLAARFERTSGHKIVMTSDTSGGIGKRVEAGQVFDVVLSSRAAIDRLAADGRLQAGSQQDFPATAIGVAVKEGAPMPDISTLAAFRETLHRVRTLAYVDPASGGTSGIYIAGVIDRLGMTEEMRPKLRLKAGGYVAELVASGEAELAIHQISEILPVKGAALVGEIPAEIQQATVYSGGLAPVAAGPAKAFLAYLAGPEAVPVLAAAGMSPRQ